MFFPQKKIITPKIESKRRMNHTGAAGGRVYKEEVAFPGTVVTLFHPLTHAASLSFHFQQTNDEEMPSK